MPDIKIVTEVAGRVCALPVTTGGNVGDGDEIAFVEAMKMEIPVTSTTAGTIKAILVKLDDVIAEGQVVAIIEAYPDHVIDLLATIPRQSVQLGCRRLRT
jgi:biotin carboxyl carrier protein